MISADVSRLAMCTRSNIISVIASAQILGLAAWHGSCGCQGWLHWCRERSLVPLTEPAMRCCTYSFGKRILTQQRSATCWKWPASTPCPERTLPHGASGTGRVLVCYVLQQRWQLQSSSLPQVGAHARAVGIADLQEVHLELLSVTRSGGRVQSTSALRHSSAAQSAAMTLVP